MLLEVDILLFPWQTHSYTSFYSVDKKTVTLYSGVMGNIKKYIAECIGTFILVATAVGVAAFTGGDVVPTAMAFGLALIAIIYIIGPISGAHVNPAVSIAFLIGKKMTLKDFAFYVVAQVVGAILGGLFIFSIVMLAGGEASIATMGANAYEPINPENVGMAIFAALLIETLLTFIFVLVILMVVNRKANKAIAPIVIGLALLLVHLVAIPVTGTSVNPARSFGSAVFGGVDALRQVWLFLLAPMLGGALAAVASMFIFRAEKEVEGEATDEPAEKTKD